MSKTLKNKNVLEIFPLFSSAEVFVGDRFSFLRENGFNMHLICSPDERLEEFAKKQGISYKAIALERQVSIKKDLIAFIEILKYIKQNKISIVICNQSKAKLLGILASCILRVPERIVFAHGAFFETMTGLKRKCFILFERIISFLSTKIICVSNSVAKVRIENKIDSNTKQYFLGKGTCNGIDTQFSFNPDNKNDIEIQQLKKGFKIQSKDFVIGFCGRLVKDKGIVELVKGFDLLVNQYPDKKLKLLIIGYKEKRDSIPEQFYQAMENNKNIIFTGRVNHNSISNYYSLLDVLVLPSYREGFPTVVLEASSMGIPIITSRSTGCIDSIQEKITGLYCDISPESIKDTIVSLFDEQNKKKMGEYARKWTVENFDNNKIWDDFLKILI